MFIAEMLRSSESDVSEGVVIKDISTPNFLQESILSTTTVIYARVRNMATDTIIEEKPIADNAKAPHPSSVGIPKSIIEGTKDLNLDPQVNLFIETIPVYPYSGIPSLETKRRVLVAEKYRAHQENIGYLNDKEGEYGGHAVSGTVVGYTGMISLDEKEKPFVQTKLYILDEPGNMSLKELVRRKGYTKQIAYNRPEIVIEGKLSLEDAMTRGYVFSDFRRQAA